MEESYWDFIRTVFTDPDLDNVSLRQILEGFIDQVGSEIQNEFIELSDEETKARVAELYGLIYELSDQSLVEHGTWILKNCLNFREAETLYLEFVFSNPLVEEEVLSMVVRSDPGFSISELLLQTIRGNVEGSRQYTFERIRPYVRPPYLTRQVISSFIEMAKDMGDVESLGFLRKLFSEDYFERTVRANISKEAYERIKEEECRQLAIYRIKLTALLKEENLDVEKMSKPNRYRLRKMLEEVSGMTEVEEGAMQKLLDDHLITPRQIRFLELVRWIETNPIFSRLYGPYNPPRLFGSSVFGSQNPELPEFPDDPRRFYMLYNPPPKVIELDPKRAESMEIDWYRGLCDFCHRQIPVRQQAFRTPLHEGGWEGCFCSSQCSLKSLLSGMDYGIPNEELDGALDRIRSHLEFFLNNDLGMGWIEGLGFLIREFPLVQYDDEGETYTTQRRIRMPKVIVLPAREERVEGEMSEKPLEDVLRLGEEVLAQLGLDREFLGDEPDPIRYTSEIILKRQHLERYALTILMNISLGSNPLIII